MDKQALFNIGYGLYVLTVNDGVKDNGCIINTVNQVASDPCKIALSVSKLNYTHDVLRKTKIANISILDEKSNFDIFKQFGFCSGRDTDKFSDFQDTKRSENGILYLTKSVNSYLSIKVCDEIDLSSHTLFIADLKEAKTLVDTETLTYCFYQKNIKPKKETTEKKGWICKICNYVYEGEVIPDDFICPLCKHPKEDFVKL